MGTQRTYRQIAASWELWCEYIDPAAADTREGWDALSMDERLAVIVACCGPEPAYAVLVRRSDSGTYEIIGEPEDWSEVCEQADSVERVESLLGWGEFQSAWKVNAYGGTVWYFVTVVDGWTKDEEEEAERVAQEIGRGIDESGKVDVAAYAQTYTNWTHCVEVLGHKRAMELATKARADSWGERHADEA